MSGSSTRNEGRLRPALFELTLYRLREIFREPEALFWVFAFPVLLSIVLGFAFREKPPERIPIGVVGAPGAQAGGAGAESPRAHKLAHGLAKSPLLLPRVFEPDEGDEALRAGRISLLIRVGEAVTFAFDETRPDSLNARLAAEDALQRAEGRRDALTVHTEKVTQKGSRYIDFLIPGLIGLNLMGTGVWSLAFSITNARGRGVLKRLVATPMTRLSYMAGQILGRLVFLIPEVGVLLLFGFLAFDVHVHGSLFTFAFVCLVGAIAFCGIGLLTGSRTKTFEGVSGLANLVLLPMWLFSGVFFSSERFPDAVQPAIRALPLTALNEALRAVMIEGRGLLAIAPRLGIVTAWGVVAYWVAIRIFKWR